jgi:hypothetical protein
MVAQHRPDFRSPAQSVTQARGFRNRSNRSGYLLKGVSGHELAGAVRTAAAAVRARELGAI